jgi:serine/threonine-protein kinase
MQYVEGKNLAEVLKEEGCLDAAEAVRIIARAAQGIEHAHRHGIIHRDIKPSNIILDDSGGVKVMDFGLARSTEELSKLTQSGTLIGTLDYMSPEQCHGEEVDGRTDIYSLGVVLYEALAGRTPFEAPNEAALINKIVNEDMPDIQTLNPDVPIKLSKIIFKALAKDRDNRYSEIGELIEDLRSCAEALEPAKATTLLGVDAPSRSRQNRLGIAAGILVLVCLSIIGILFLRESKEPATALKGKTYSSIAVLPFADMSPDKDQEYFCDGISEELINALAQIEDLRVIARTSAFSFKGQNIDIREIADKLDVETILEGSIRKSGNRLRITAQLVDVSTNDHVWSERYDKEAKDIFAIQDEITLAIVDNLKIKLLGGRGHALAERQVIDLEAYDLYLRGRHLVWNRSTEEDLEKAIRYFEQVLEMEPNYAPVYAEIAAAYHFFGVVGTIPAIEYVPLAKTAALRAVELDETLAQPYISLAWGKMIRYDWEGAKKDFEHAIELNPNSALAHSFYGGYLMNRGQSEKAILEVRKAHELDPLSPFINWSVANTLTDARRYDEAFEVLERAVELNPRYPGLMETLGWAYELKGRYEEALQEYREYCEIMGYHDFYGMGTIYVKMGKVDEARKILESRLAASEKGYVRPYEIAFLYLSLGDKDKAFEWLEKAYDAGDGTILDLMVDPDYDSIRSDPRYLALLRKMNLEPLSEEKARALYGKAPILSSSKIVNDKTYTSIAVLPFADMSPGKDQEYFCDGMSEELINALAQFEDLRVIARTSAFSFKGQDIDVRNIGKALNVDAILEGSVRKAGNKVRITAQLVDTRGGHHLWSDKYDRDLEDIFAVQDEITEAIVDKLKPKLLQGEEAKPAIQRTIDPEAHDLYLRGEYLVKKLTADDIEKAYDYFERAIEKDPNFALPYVGLALYYDLLHFVGPMPPKEIYPKAMELTQKALEIDDTVSEAHSMLGWIRSFYEWDWASGEREFKRALELNPSNIDAQAGYAQMLAFMGRFEEAIDIAKRAVDLDPVSTHTNLRLGEVLLFSGKYEEAMEHLQKSIEMFPNHAYMRMNLAATYVAQSKFEEALREYHALKSLSLGPVVDFQADSMIGITYAFMGETDKAKKILVDLEERSKEVYVPPFFIARFYFVLEDQDKAYKWLDLAYEEHDYWLGLLKIMPGVEMLDYDPRSDPRYLAMLKRINLAD